MIVIAFTCCYVVDNIRVEAVSASLVHASAKCQVFEGIAYWGLSLTKYLITFILPALFHSNRPIVNCRVCVDVETEPVKGANVADRSSAKQSYADSGDATMPSIPNDSIQQLGGSKGEV